MMPPSLFREPTFSGVTTLTVLLYAALGGAMFLLPFLLIHVHAYSATAAGAAFLPFSANAVDRAFGGAGEIAPMPRIDEAEDLDGGASYPIITGDYSGAPAWRRHPLVVGTPVSKPTPVFTKLDPSVVDEELARLMA